MTYITDDEMMRILHACNPWWNQKPVPQSMLRPFMRYDHSRLTEQIKGKSIMAIMGARRVGKTTLLYQIIDMLLQGEYGQQQCMIEPAHILFAPLDDPYLFMSQENFAKMLDVYVARILRKNDLGDLEADQRAYIILDEIQGLKNWQIILKRWFDIGHNVKFIITGSSSAGILDGSSESLTGRITYSTVSTMGFSEYVRFKNPDKLAGPFAEISACLYGLMQDAAGTGKICEFYDRLTQIKRNLLPYENAIKAMLDEYIIRGGYPENVLISDAMTCAENLRSYLNLTLYKDAMRISGARDPVALESLFAIIAKESSSVFSRTNVSKTLGIGRSTTLNQYLSILKDTYMISESKFYSKSTVKRARKESKMYVNDIGLRNAACMTFDPNVLTDGVEIGRMSETVAYNHTCKMLARHTMGLPGMETRVSYWHDGYEVDMVAELPSRHVVPIEVKYRERVTMSDLKGLKRFEKKFGASIMMTVTKNQLELKDNTLFVPLWLYLLLC